MALTLLVVSLVVMVILGAPIGIAMAAVPAIYIWATGELPLSAVPYQMFEAVAMPPLLAIPFFILTAELMNSGQITARLLTLARELVGRIRGGLAQMNIVGSMMFASISGSAVADVAAIGGVLIPAMRKEGYPGPLSAALTAMGSTMGGILPPSILLVILASTMGISIGSVFAAGVLPGMCVGAILMGMVYVLALRQKWGRYKVPFTFTALLKAIQGAWGALLIPAIIAGGIISGVFTAAEAGAVAALLALLLGTVVYRTLTPRALLGALTRAVKVASSVFIIIAASGPLSWLLNRIGALEGLQGFLLQFSHSPILFSLVLVGLVLVIGTLLEPVPAVVMLGPTLVHVCVQAGFHEIQAAILLATGFILGSVTPPVGICYFTAAAIGGEKVDDVARAIIPFLAADVVVMFIVLLVPAMTLALPRLLGLI